MLNTSKIVSKTLIRVGINIQSDKGRLVEYEMQIR